jgi:hypothetical protein
MFEHLNLETKGSSETFVLLYHLHGVIHQNNLIFILTPSLSVILLLVHKLVTKLSLFLIKRYTVKAYGRVEF